MSATVEAVRSALEEVIDPCSVSAGVPLSVCEMGLVQDVRLSDGRVSIVLRLSSPGCLMGGFYFEPRIVKRVGDVPGITSVHVSFADPMTWSESEISEEGRFRLAAARKQRNLQR